MPALSIDYVLQRGVAEIIVEQELRGLLASDAPLRLKMGFDPSRSDLHLGYAVALRKLRQLQDLGHQAILIVGDWTARIGDSSGLSATREMLSEAQVNENAQSYMRQFFRVVDREKTEVVWQSEWFGKFSLSDIIGLTSKFTVAQMLAREDFAQRYASQRPIALTEFLYPLLQGYDSVAIRADVEFGGMDQKFNCLVGRDLQGMTGQRPQQVFLLPLLLGTDGRKMSQSYGNYIAFEDQPDDMYGKLMSIPDGLMMDYFELLTDVADAELEAFRQQLTAETVHPMELKHRLAGEIVTQFHSCQAARDAEAHFRRVVQQRDVPEDIPLRSLRELRNLLVDGDPSNVTPSQIIELLSAWHLVESKGEARRLISQGGVEVDGVRIKDGGVHLREGSIIQVGKRRYVQFVAEDVP